VLTSEEQRRIEYSELKDGRKGVGIGEESLFLEINFSCKWKRWGFRLWDMRERHYISEWVNLKSPEKLKRNRKAKPIRDVLGDDLKRVVAAIQQHEERWRDANLRQRSSDCGDEEGGRPKQAKRLVVYCLSEEPTLFLDQTETPYARIRKRGVKVTLPLRSRAFKNWLASLMWHIEERVPNRESIGAALNVLEAITSERGQRIHLYNRMARDEDGGIWIDMADPKWRAIHVTKEGWEIVDDPPILFKRYAHQKPLVEPKRGGNPRRFLGFVNIDRKDENAQLLLLIYLTHLLIPDIPHVILVLYGIQGSGKSLFLRLIRSLIDPSAVDLLTVPRNERERTQQLDHHWLAFYDNVSWLSETISNTFCRAATGGGFTKRELYTDDEDIIYNFRRCVAVNGINVVATRGDLLDRCLLQGLEHIPRNQRCTEEQLLAEFESCKAEILGGFVDILVKAMELYSTVNPKELFRMADFTRWGCAIAKALGYPDKQFIRIYGEKVRTQIEEAAHTSILATVLLDFMEQFKQKWEGTPSELWKTLINHAKEMKISTHQKAFPKAPHVLTRRLNELAPSLKELGWEVITDLRVHGGVRKIVIDSTPEVSRNTVTRVSSATNKGNSLIERFFSKKEHSPEEARSGVVSEQSDAVNAGDASPTNLRSAQCLQCPECKSYGKKVFFSSEHDLKIHLTRIHGKVISAREC